jgi:hypothetical protein
MTRAWPGLVVAGLIGVAPLVAGAAGPFDGVWAGRSINESGNCPFAYDVRFTVRDGRVSGEMVSGAERITLATTVDQRGRVGRIVGYNGRTILRTSSGRLGDRRGRIDWWGHGATSRRGRGGICYGYIEVEKVSGGR